MAGVRFSDVQARPTEFLDMTSLTLEEFQQLVPAFEAAFQAHMAAWRLDGKPRTARQFSVYKNCPLPTPEDRLFFILTYPKTYALQVVHGRLFGMGQSKANQWMHVLLPALLAALRALGDALSAPSRLWRSAEASQRLTRRPWAHRWRKQIPPDLVVKSQPTDIIDIIFNLSSAQTASIWHVATGNQGVS